MIVVTGVQSIIFPLNHVKKIICFTIQKTTILSVFFITKYENLYGKWSEDFAYRSHMFNISFDDYRQSYYTAADPPQFIVDEFTKKDMEIVLWDKELSKFHPLLQKAKKEAAELTPPIHKSIPTRIWNQTTPDYFWAEWEARKNK